MTPCYQFAFTSGEDWEQLFSWKPGGVIINLTGYTALMQFRPHIGGPILDTLSTATGEITLGLFTEPVTSTQYNIRAALPFARTALLKSAVTDFLLIWPGDTNRKYLFEAKTVDVRRPVTVPVTP